MDTKCFGGASSLRDLVAEELKTLARRAVLALLAVVATAMAAHAQGADAFPARPITLVVPFAPSGGNDIMARLVGERMGKVFGQQIVVENRPGAGGNIGSRHPRAARPTVTRCCSRSPAPSASIRASTPISATTRPRI